MGILMAKLSSSKLISTRRKTNFLHVRFGLHEVSVSSYTSRTVYDECTVSVWAV